MDILTFLLQRPTEAVLLFVFGCILGFTVGLRLRRWWMEEKINLLEQQKASLEEKLKKRESEKTDLTEENIELGKENEELKMQAAGTKPLPPAPSPPNGPVPHASLRVSEEEALRLIRGIGHAKITEDTISRKWKVYAGKRVANTSVAWLFVWGYTGMSSPTASQKAKQAFNGILSVGFDEYERNVGVEQARRIRAQDPTDWGS
jgi:hypothetical protein